MKRKDNLGRCFSALLAIAIAAMSLTPALRQASAADALSPVDLSARVTEPAAPALPQDLPAAQPANLGAPLSLVRVQSAARPSELSGGLMTITFTVFNNLPPILRPELPNAATITESIALLSAHDYRQDPNTIRSVLVTDTLLAAAEFASASPAVSRAGNAIVWSLGDLPPMGSLTATLTLSVTPGGGDFTPLDGGPVALATLNGRRVSAAGAASQIASEALGAFLSRTVDADTRDDYMLRKAAELQHASGSLFELVKGMGNEVYAGSLRGTRGTLWGGAGNALDKSSLLIALLRASGVPARYRHGSLSTATAQALIASMFITPTRIEGYVPAGAPVSDPLNDAALLAEAGDHWWVEAYLAGAWTDLDPSFAAATPGATFQTSTAGDGTDRIAEVPDAQRHKVTVRLKVQKYNNYLGGLQDFYPISRTFASVEVAGKPVALAHVVNAQVVNGAVFANNIVDYTPYFIVGDDTSTAEIVVGAPFQDLVSNFASVTNLHVAEWLQFDLREPGGATRTFEREVIDLIGYDKRQNGGAISFASGSQSQPMVQTTDMFSTWFWSGRVPFEALQRTRALAINLTPQFSADLTTINTLQYVTPRAPEQEAQYTEAQSRMQLNIAARLALVGLTFAVRADDALAYFGAATEVKAYYAAPRIVSVGSLTGISATVNSDAFTIDLRRTSARAVGRPGQSAEAPYALQQMKGYLESQYEQDALEEAAGLPAISTARVISQALALGVPLVRIDDTLLDELADLSLSDQARARITSAVVAGKEVLVPTEGISISGRLRYAWFESDRLTGEMVGVMENGLHTAAIEYGLLLSGGLKALTAFMLGMAVGLWSALTPVLVSKLGGDKSQAVATMKVATKSADAYAKAFCEGPNKIVKKACNLAYKGGKKVGASLVSASDPPLPEIEYAIPSAPLPTHAAVRATGVMTTPANLPTGAISASLSTALVAAYGAGDASLYAGVSNGLSAGGDYPGASNFAPAATLAIASGGVNLDGASGVLTLGGTAVPPPERFAIANFTGGLSVADAGASDNVTLNGSGDVFALTLSAPASAISPMGNVAFTALMSSSVSGAYSLTVEGPEGWTVAVGGAGAISAQSGLGAPAGTYALVVVAQSKAYPRLSVSAVHTVTISAFQGMQMSVAPNPLTSVPYGVNQSDNPLNDTNDGRMQLSGAAFRVDITNTSNLTRSFAANVAGLSASWLIYGGQTGTNARTVALPPGGVGRFGLYISPTLGLPPAGTSYPFTVSVTGVENPSLTGSDSDLFVVPGTPYAHLTLSQPFLFSAPGATSTLNLRLFNVGNATAAFPILFDSPAPGWTANYAASMSAGAGATATQPITIVAQGALGQDYVVGFTTSSGGYSQTANTLIILTTPQAACAYAAAYSLADLGSAAPTATLDAVAAATAALEGDPSNVAKRDALVSALNALSAAQNGLAPLPALASLQALAASLAGHIGQAQIGPDLAALCALMGDLAGQLRAAITHDFEASFSPGAAAGLPGRPVNLTFALTNRGSLSTSFNVTLTSPVLGGPIVLAPVLASGATSTQTVVLTLASAGFAPVYADVTAFTGAPAMPLFMDSAIAGVSFISPVLQALDVVANPGFVDFGTSATSLTARVANIANWKMTAAATLTVIAPNGAISATLSAPLSLNAGDPIVVSFGSLNTSGFQTGIYTVTVSAVVTAPEGLAGATSTSYGFFAVGQALYATAAVAPAVVAPGNVTVTTIVTTFVTQGAAPALALRPKTEDGGPKKDRARRLTPGGGPQHIDGQPQSSEAAPKAIDEADDPSPVSNDASLVTGEASRMRIDRPEFTGAILRTEVANPGVAKTGTWSNVASAQLASGSSYSRSSAISSTLAFTFSGPWVSVGYLAGDDGRQFEIFLDGVSEGVIDSYANRSNLPQSKVLAGLANATHVISISVLSGKNAWAAATAYAKIDHFDVWDGTTLADGTFEQSDGRVILGGGWTTTTLAGASGGNYARSGLGATTGSAWFAFTGDSVTYRMVNDFSNAGAVSIYVDGFWKADVDQYSAFANMATSTPTISFDGLGAGAHVLSLVSRRGSYISLDAFATPGVAPFYAPTTRTGIIRYEENDSALRYNGAPFTATKTSWNENYNNYASTGFLAYSSVASDTISLTFTGAWASLGYIANTNAGRVEVFVDGVSRGVIDTYGNGEAPRSFTLPSLGGGAHTLTVTALGTRNAFAGSPGNFYFDYLDVWDGSTLADGTLQEDSARIWMTGGWDRIAQAAASGGAYGQSAFLSGAAWFAFSGDSVTYQFFNGYNNAGQGTVYIDGGFATVVDFASPLTGTTNFTRALSFSGLGAGPHVLTLHLTRGYVASMDAFITPGSAPFYTAPSVAGTVRYEEDNPALRYNGVPYTATKSSWFENPNANASAGYYRASSTTSDTVSLAFTGTWASLGFLAAENAGRIEVFIDGASRGVIDTYGNDTQTRNAVFSGLGSGSHTLSVTLLATRNAFANSPGYFYLDHIDVSDGVALPDGVFEENSGRIWYSGAWTRPANAGASGGNHAVSGLGTGAVWFAFTGDSVTYKPVIGFNNAGVVNVMIDGAFRARLDLSAGFTGTANYTRSFSFNGLGAGPHILTAYLARGYFASVDSFATPGEAPFYAEPARSGIIRYEEFDVALRYNGAPYTATKSSWFENANATASAGYYRASSATSDTVSLAFTGTWASLGYLAAANAGRIEVFIDGASLGVIDAYGRSDESRSVVITGLSAGAHTISVTALGTRNAFAAPPGYFHVDYFDIWDGSVVGDGALDEANPRVFYSGNWARQTSTAAEGGAYGQSGLGSGTAWAAFAGDSVTFNYLAGFNNAGEMGIWIDGRFREWVDLAALAPMTRSLSYSGLGAGPHVLTAALHRGFFLSFDTLRTPGAAPFRDGTRGGVYRIEEDDPALRYNGAPFTQTKTNWADSAQGIASDKYVARTSAVSDTVSLTFDGAWVSAGFIARTDGRQVEVFLDGLSQGVVDLYSASDDVVVRVYGGLISATHILSFSVLSSVNVSATGGTKWAYFDYIDVWDGTQEPRGLFQHDPAEQDGGRIYLSGDWSVKSRVAAISGTFIDDGSNVWFLFTGISVTVIGVTDNLTPSKAEIFIDGVSQGLLDLSYAFGRSPVPLTLSGLGAGAHVLRYVDRSGAGSNLGAGLDGFDTRPTPFAGIPMVEWASPAASSSEGFDTSPVVGDLDGDGIPEVVVTSSGENCFFGLCTFTNKALYVFRGDTGGLIFSRTITGTSPSCTGGAICGGTGAPLIVDLDGGGDAEIVVDSSSGLRAYKNDGTLMWWNQGVRGTWASASATGNLDDDDAPEIVAVHDDYGFPVTRRIHIVQPDGVSSWTYTLPTTAPGPRMPVLADLNGDGRLDIIVASGQTLYAFHNNGVSMTLAYTRSSGLDHYGAPAVADIDADGLPEIIIGWTGIIAAYENDLTLKWVYTTGGIYPSTVSVADLDGDDDGLPELVIFSKTSPGVEDGRVFVLNHDGSLLWSQPARDTTNSSAGVAVLDLDGDGAYEVVWNGYLSGTTIYAGRTGEILFNDETINSGTVNETPVIADVDADGHAELVLVDNNQLVALGFDQGWASSRSIWNQHSYHITNINDDLSVPPREPDSWAYHNTYRTQSPLDSPAPVYYIEVSHTIAPSMTVVPGSFSRAYTDVNPVYRWGYSHYWYESSRETRFDAVLAGVQPGEVRRVSEGSVVSYTVGAGRNRIAIPPLYVSAAHILSLAPAALPVQRGASANFSVV
ncbi:MAG: FG-GAP-like repeat-containing protein, partial [Thermoflexales bacterium]